MKAPVLKSTTRALMLSLLCTVGIASSSAATIAPGTLTVGSDMTYPPYESLDGNDPVGFDPEFMSKMSTHLKVTPKFVDTRFANLILGLTGNRYDVIVSALYVTPERAKTLDFIPYFMTGGSLMANASGDYKPKTMEDLCGKRVGSLKGAAWVPTLHEVSEKACQPAGKGAIDVREFDTSSEAAQALLSRAVDAQYDDSGVAKMIVGKLNGRVVITSTGPMNPVVCGIAFKKGNDGLKQQVADAFVTMKRNGEYQALLKKYNLVEPTAQDVARATGSAK
ncbi:ABC transporter substrate-binding protein [Caballeronia sp. GAFFF1]|uniref:ABC transporter substrate-binding protein n=1 Tax=Caballeronia sp. GAFFF1 TaxID=2921779 RepID=UPI0020279D1A|nr:ABC transporter substrate-binding protein [Caballeronia sp. GAFFF1]